MQLRRFSFVFQLFAAIAAFGLVASAHGQSLTYKQEVLYSFKGGIIDGGNPWGGLVRDSAGNLYGATRQGGINGCPGLAGCGVIFKLDPTGKETILYFFTGGTDGGTPLGGLVRDEEGNLYGTNSEGGNAGLSCGTVYKLDTSKHLTVIYTFPSCFYQSDDGPQSGLVRDGKGNLYGTTYTDGTAFLGTIFKIDTSGTFTVLHNFSAWEGNTPYLDPLTLGPDGNLYGVTRAGGTNSAGVVYKVTPTGKYTVLYSFTGGIDGWFPSGKLVIDKSGNVYGATYFGGSSFWGAGVAFEIEKSGLFSLLHTFTHGFGGTYGGGLIQDDAGNLYGTTAWAGAYALGSVFMIDANKKIHNLYTFKGGRDGDGPFAPMIRDDGGNLYGTTSSGGEWGSGVVFELSPN